MLNAASFKAQRVFLVPSGTPDMQGAPTGNALYIGYVNYTIHGAIGASPRRPQRPARRAC